MTTPPLGPPPVDADAAPPVDADAAPAVAPDTSPVDATAAPPIDATAAPPVDAAASRSSLRELAALFTRLGLTAFGGPAAHVALMEGEVVRRRGWLTRAQFLDLVGATQLIPGPNST